MNSASRIQGYQLFSAQGAALSQEDHVLGRRERGLFVVADGFGGAQAGQDASRVACESVLSFLEKEAGDLEATLPFVLRSYFSLAANVLFNAVLHANQKVVERNQGKSANEKGGASVVSGFLDEGLFALANVGSCSAWLFRGGQIKELVTPRTYSRLRDPLEVDPDPEAAVPLMAMGISRDLEPEIIEFQVAPGDVVLLQTDGIREETRKIIRTQIASGQESALETLLKEQDFSENASLALIRFR